jgi:branched-chain amino acid transport system permease protein
VTSTRGRVAAAALVLALAIPLATNDYTQYIVNSILVYILVAVGFNVLLGYVGQFAFANAAFFGIGAYGTALAMVHWGAPFVLALALGGLAAALAGYLVGVPALRMSGFYLAIVTLAFGELMRWIYLHAGAVTFGPSGFSVPAPVIFGYAVAGEKAKFYLFLALTAALLAATARLIGSGVGRAFVAVRDNELAAAALAIAPARYKLIGFVWSGFVVGIAGGMFSVLLGRITPDSFGLSELLLHFVIVIIGGLGSLAGSVLGAIILTAAPELLRNFPGIEEVVFSLLLIVCLLFMPRGIGGLLVSIIPAMRDDLFRRGR